jgi:hypothetical protein
MRNGRLQTFFLAGLLIAVGLATAAPSLGAPAKRVPLTQAGPDGLTRALARGELTPAEYALERADSLFHPLRVAARYGPLSRPNPRDATLILRDLAIRMRYLSGFDRERALALLARPTDSTPGDPDRYTTAEATPVCGTNVCIHYVTTTTDTVGTTDVNDGQGGAANGIPDYVDEALRVFDTEVWGFEVATRGFKAPKSDIDSANNGTSSSDPTGAMFDVYLAQIGDDNLYGYCTTDDPNVTSPSSHYQFFDASAYCVVDNNFTGDFFPATGHTPLENLEVTAAHEFFHAVQFAYDAFEDQWFLESTATWMEDENLLYDDVDDNVNYLPDGPLGKPLVPLDKGATNADPCCHVYGDWIFFRYLTEKYSPGLVKTIWNNADASEDTDGLGPDGVGRDDFSIQAVARAVSHKGGFRSRFAEFGWRNRIARLTYGEGDDNAYPRSPLTSSANTLSRNNRQKSKSVDLKHQTNAYFEFKRGSGLSSTAKLRLVLNLPAKSTGAAASVLVFNKNGTVSPFTLGITSAGDGAFKVPFGSSVSKVDVVLTNASTRYTNCYPAPQNATPYACSGGKPRDDGLAYKVTAKV